MALRAGLKFERLEDIPQESRPDAPTISVEDLPTGQGKRHRGRKGSDGTRWCICCYFTLDAASHQVKCPTCKSDTDRGRMQRRRAQGFSISVPASVVDDLVNATSEVDMCLGRILSAKHADRKITKDMLFELASASKKVSALISAELMARKRRAPAR